MAQIVNNKLKILVHNKIVGHVVRKNQKILIHYQLGTRVQVDGCEYTDKSRKTHNSKYYNTVECRYFLTKISFI